MRWNAKTLAEMREEAGQKPGCRAEALPHNAVEQASCFVAEIFALREEIRI